MPYRRAIVIIVVLLVACQPAKPKQPPLTTRQYDSVVGASGLPGATGVRGALRVADSQKAANARFDSATRQP